MNLEQIVEKLKSVKTLKEFKEINKEVFFIDENYEFNYDAFSAKNAEDILISFVENKFLPKEISKINKKLFSYLDNKVLMNINYISNYSSSKFYLEEDNDYTSLSYKLSGFNSKIKPEIKPEIELKYLNIFKNLILLNRDKKDLLLLGHRDECILLFKYHCISYIKDIDDYCYVISNNTNFIHWLNNNVNFIDIKSDNDYDFELNFCQFENPIFYDKMQISIKSIHNINI